MIINTRQKQIMKELMTEKNTISGDKLASLIKVTPRTIRKDISEINQQLKNIDAEIITIRGKGYQIEVKNEDKFKKFIYQAVKMDEEIPVEPQDRLDYLVRKFLLATEYLKSEELADELYVSTSTLKNDLKNLKRAITKYGLTIEKKPKYGLKIKGTEKNFRFAISELILQRIGKDSRDNNWIDWLLKEEDTELIFDITLRTLRKYDLQLSDVGLNNLVTHIAIACKRIKSKQLIEDNPQIDNDIELTKEYKVAEIIVREIESDLNLSFPDVEITYVSMHLLGTRLILNDVGEKLNESHDSNIIEVVMSMIERVNKQMDLNIQEDKELVTALVLHLKPTIYRFKHNMNIRNPMLEAIKKNYPVAFEAGVIAGKEIENRLSIKVDENEIGYIALHFGAALERVGLKDSPLRCLIVCTTGLGSSQLLFYKIKSKFAEKVNILGVTELYNLPLYKNKDVDFIISTVPLPDSITIPSVIVDTMLSENELPKIEQMISNKNESVSVKYMKKSLIYPHLSCKTPKEVITYLGNELIKKGKAETGIIESVLEREQAASTSYGNLVAIPHPTEAKSLDTFWTIATLKKPIDWGEKKVQFVCLLHVANNSKEELGAMYESLLRLLDDRNTIQQLILAQSKEEIINIIKGL